MIPLDTFSFDIAGFNAAGTSGYLLTPDETATFGATTTFSAAGIDAQDITVTSSETVNLLGGTTTDTITVSTPTNFLTTSTVNSLKITQLQIDIGDANAGGNTLDYLLPVTGGVAAGNILYGSTNASFALSPNVTLSNSGMSLAAAEGVSAGTTAIDGLAVHSFTFSETYNTLVPEPASMSLCGAGMAGLLLTRKRRRDRGL